MNAGNRSTSNIVILLGFSYHPWSEMPVFIAVLAASIHNQWVSRVDPYLHTLCTSFPTSPSCTTTIPRLLLTLWLPRKSITRGGSVTQFCVFHFLGAAEYILLAVMSLQGHLQAFQVPSYHAPAILLSS